MANIFIGIPSVRKYKPFVESMEVFIPSLIEKHTIEIYTVSNKSRAEARNSIVSRFLSSDKEYLLFLDDDHSGHKSDMVGALLDPLINNGRLVCAIKCYSREFPYFSNLAEYSGVNLEGGIGKYRPIDENKGYIECDLVGFGMTMIAREAFNRIKEPYFISNNNCREDNYFCEKLVLSGSRPIGCFDYLLEHDGINEFNSIELRNKGIEELKNKNPDMKVLVS